MGDVSSTVELVLMLAVVGGVGYVGYKIYQNLFGAGGSGSGSSGPGLFSPGGALSPQSSSTATQQATLTTLDTLQAFYQAQPAGDNPFLPTLYQTNPGGATITPAQATGLWADLQTAYKGSGFMSFFKAEPDMSPVLQQFQVVAQTGVDISFVSSLCMADTNQNLGDWIFNSFANDQTGTSGITNMQMLANFVYWAFQLPTD